MRALLTKDGLVSLTTRLLRMLRSPRLAVWLLAILVGTVFLGTLVPQGASDAATVSSWRAAHPVLERFARPAGLHHAASSPVFLVTIALLALSTAACAAQRTSVARRAWTPAGRLTESDIARARRSPNVSLVLSRGADRSSALEAVARVARAHGMSVRSGPRALEAESRRWGVWGSPVFHWSLIALICVVAMGSLTRSEGVISLELGEPVRETQRAYDTLETGPLFGGRYSGLTLAAEDLADSLIADGVERGPAPYLTLSRGSTELRRRRVYPNNPLRYGNITVHYRDIGLMVVMSVEDSAGVSGARLPFAVRYAAGTTEAAEPSVITFLDASGAGIMDARVTVRLTGPEGAASARLPIDLTSAVVETSTPGTGDWGGPVTMRLGDTVRLPGPDGLRARWVLLDDAVMVRVVNDWSVPFIYALFASIAASVCVALLVRPRRLVAILDDEGSDVVLRLFVQAPREPAFRAAIADEIDAALAEVGESGPPGDADA